MAKRITRVSDNLAPVALSSLTTKKVKAIKTHNKHQPASVDPYDDMLSDVIRMVDAARRTAARTVNSVITATYWAVGRRIVEHEQGGEIRAPYGTTLISRLSDDLTVRFGRGFGVVNLNQMKRLYLAWPRDKIFQTVSEKSQPPNLATFSGKSQPPILQTVSEKSRRSKSSAFSGKSQPPILQTVSEKSRRSNLSTFSGKSQPPILQTVSEKSSGASSDATLTQVASVLSLPWSHYVRLLSVEDLEARKFYEQEALQGGWSVRQLDRQISTKFYERTLLSKNKAAMLKKGRTSQQWDTVTPEEEIRDPLVLEFLGLKDEYSESEFEEALIQRLESFLLELGGDFTFVARQRRLRIGNEWFRVDLLFFHRTLRCLVVIDLKTGKFTHADAGQMHMYCNYAREHWMRPGENPPVGLILCSSKDQDLARYALDGLPSKVLAAEYKTKLPDERMLAAELQKTRKSLEKTWEDDHKEQRKPSGKRQTTTRRKGKRA